MKQYALTETAETVNLNESSPAGWQNERKSTQICKNYFALKQELRCDYNNILHNTCIIELNYVV